MELDLAGIRRRLRLRDLDVLSAVLAAGSMHKAAHALHLSQSAVSKSIAELEDLVGHRLLDRGRQGVQATELGRALARGAGRVGIDLDQTLRELTHLADPEAGDVRIGAMETLLAGLVGEAVRRHHAVHPRTRFMLESGQASELIEHFLRAGLVDFVVARPFDLPLPPDMEGHPLFHERLQVVAATGHPLTRRRHLQLAHLTDELWILSRNELMDHSPVVRAFADRGLPLPRRLVESASLNLRLNLLQDRRHITCIPHSLMPFGGAPAWLKRLPLSFPPWQTPAMVITLRGRELLPAARHFLTTLRELSASLDTRPDPGGSAPA